jgi:hypothetical protein
MVVVAYFFNIYAQINVITMIMLGLIADQFALFIAFFVMIVPTGCIYGLNLSYIIILGKHGLDSAHPWLLAAISIRRGAIGYIMVFIFAAWIGVIYGFLMRFFYPEINNHSSLLSFAWN